MHHDSSDTLSSEYFDMTILCLGLVVGCCYDLDYMLIVDIGVSVITVIFWGKIPSLSWSGATEPGFSSATTFAFMGRP